MVHGNLSYNLSQERYFIPTTGKGYFRDAKTAWHMLHRIRECFDIVMDEKLDGEIELDETFVGGKNKYRHKTRK